MAQVKCVHCGKMVFELENECPYCKKPIANRFAPTNVSASPWTWKKTSYGKKFPVGLVIAGVLLIAAAIFAVYYFKSKGV